MDPSEDNPEKVMGLTKEPTNFLYFMFQMYSKVLDTADR